MNNVKWIDNSRLEFNRDTNTSKYKLSDYTKRTSSSLENILRSRSSLYQRFSQLSPSPSSIGNENEDNPNSNSKPYVNYNKSYRESCSNSENLNNKHQFNSKIDSKTHTEYKTKGNSYIYHTPLKPYYEKRHTTNKIQEKQRKSKKLSIFNLPENKGKSNLEFNTLVEGTKNINMENRENNNNINQNLPEDNKMQTNENTSSSESHHNKLNNSKKNNDNLYQSKMNHTSRSTYIQPDFMKHLEEMYVKRKANNKELTKHNSIHTQVGTIEPENSQIISQIKKKINKFHQGFKKKSKYTSKNDEPKEKKIDDVRIIYKKGSYQTVVTSCKSTKSIEYNMDNTNNFMNQTAERNYDINEMYMESTPYAKQYHEPFNNNQNYNFSNYAVQMLSHHCQEQEMEYKEITYYTEKEHEVSYQSFRKSNYKCKSEESIKPRIKSNTSQFENNIEILSRNISQRSNKYFKSDPNLHDGLSYQYINPKLSKNNFDYNDKFSFDDNNSLVKYSQDVFSDKEFNSKTDKPEKMDMSKMNDNFELNNLKSNLKEFTFSKEPLSSFKSAHNIFQNQTLNSNSNMMEEHCNIISNVQSNFKSNSSKSISSEKQLSAFQFSNDNIPENMQLNSKNNDDEMNINENFKSNLSKVSLPRILLSSLKSSHVVLSEDKNSKTHTLDNVYIAPFDSNALKSNNEQSKSTEFLLRKKSSLVKEMITKIDTLISHNNSVTPKIKLVESTKILEKSLSELNELKNKFNIKNPNEKSLDNFWINTNRESVQHIMLNNNYDLYKSDFNLHNKIISEDILNQSNCISLCSVRTQSALSEYLSLMEKTETIENYFLKEKHCKEHLLEKFNKFDYDILKYSNPTYKKIEKSLNKIIELTEKDAFGCSMKWFLFKKAVLSQDKQSIIPFPNIFMVSKAGPDIELLRETVNMIPDLNSLNSDHSICIELIHWFLNLKPKIKLKTCSDEKAIMYEVNPLVLGVKPSLIIQVNKPCKQKSMYKQLYFTAAPLHLVYKILYGNIDALAVQFNKGVFGFNNITMCMKYIQKISSDNNIKPHIDSKTNIQDEQYEDYVLIIIENKNKLKDNEIIMTNAGNKVCLFKKLDHLSVSYIFFYEKLTYDRFLNFIEKRINNNNKKQILVPKIPINPIKLFLLILITIWLIVLFFAFVYTLYGDMTKKFWFVQTKNNIVNEDSAVNRYWNYLIELANI